MKQVTGICFCLLTAGFLGGVFSPLLEQSAFAQAPATPTSPTGTPAPETPVDTNSPFPQRFDAPSLDGGVGWLNINQPLSWKELRGKVVVLDFWTYCCINCMHVLPDLAYLEQKYEKELVVIGVHSAKFENEQDSEAIRSAIQRYEIKHPVVNDAEMTIWRKFGVRSWPTFVVIDPDGKYIGYLAGEGNREILDSVVGKLVDYHRKKGTLNEEPLKFDLETDKLADTPLRFPGKVLSDEAGNRLFISDSNHNRIVVTSLTGELLAVIGSGKIGSADGDYQTAEFDHPQGMELVGNQLYVADTENHLIRVIDLENQQVTTLAGTGQQARGRGTGGPLRTTGLGSPWALKAVNGVLYIAMAGPHQLWKHTLGSKTIEVYAGSGREDITDGFLMEAALAQPSGITANGSTLYFVDSEGSAVRQLNIAGRSRVTTLAGPRNLPNGRSLFEFGDIDAPGDKARFQHPLGIVYHEDRLFVADSYNHKIRQIDLKTGAVSTFLGTGKPGSGLGPEPQLSEPAGLTIAGQMLFIADTNNHRILAVNLQDRSVRSFDIPDLTAPR